MFTIGESLGHNDGRPATVLRLGGEVDIMAASSLRQAGLTALDRGSGDLVVDLSGVSFLDSSGLSALVALRNHAVASGRAVLVTGFHGTVKRVFEITGLEAVFSGHDEPEHCPG